MRNLSDTDSGNRIDQLVRAVKWIWSYAGSFWLLAALMLMLSMWLIPFQFTGQSTGTIEAIAWGWLPLQVLYVLVGISTLMCTWERFRRDLRRIGRGPKRTDSPTQGAVLVEGIDGDGLSKRLQKSGYEVAEDENGLRAVRRRWSPIGGSVFHIAILLFVIGIIVHQQTAVGITLRVIEGQPLLDTVPPDAEWARADVAGLSLIDIQPEYFEDVLLFTDLDATLVRADGSQEKMSLSNPKWLDMFTHLSIQDFGFAPQVKVSLPDGEVRDQATVAMNVFPPGSEDSVEMADGSLRIHAVVYPDYGVVNGQDVSLSYNRDNPRLKITVESTTDKNILARGLVAEGESLQAGEEVVEIEGLSNYGTFRISRSFGVPIIAFAGILMTLGLAFRLLIPRHDVVAWSTPDGLMVDAWLDSYGRGGGHARLTQILKKGDEVA